jgi:SET domain-containing protein
MFLVKVYLRSSPIHGLGCFAGERIHKLQKVWVFDSRIDTRIPYDSLHRLPEATREYLDIYGYVEMVDDRKVVTHCGDFARHMNHSDTPNVASVFVPGVNLATRDIEEGEELTCSYYDFDLEADDKIFSSGNLEPGG